jgi:hypothetical protein
MVDCCGGGDLDLCTAATTCLDSTDSSLAGSTSAVRTYIWYVLRSENPPMSMERQRGPTPVPNKRDELTMQTAPTRNTQCA